MRLFFGILILLTIVISGCSNENPEKNTSNAPEKISFNIDSSQIAGIIINSELKIKFNPPKNWDSAAQNIFKLIKEQVQSGFRDSSKIGISPVYMFINDSIKSFLSVSTLEFENIADPFGVKMKQYKSFLVAKFESNKIQQANFIKDNIHISQFLIQKEDIINFKILFSNHKSEIIQFDYMVGKEFYPNEIKAIESSIGSIQMIN